MARTIRRKSYVPRHVTEDWRYVTDPRTGESFYGRVQLEGKERAKQLRWWHEDKSCWWGARPPKFYRKMHEDTHRADSKTELVRWVKNADYEPLVSRKALLGYWD